MLDIISCDNTVTSKTVAMSNLDMVHKAHHKHPWELHFALVGTNKVQTLGYILILGSCDLAHWLWRYGHSKSVIPLQQFCTCYDSLLGLHSFPHLVLSCHVSFPRVPFLCLSSLSSYPGTPYIHCTRPLTPTPFLALLPDRGYSFAYHFLVMDTYSSSWFSRISCVPLLLILFSMTFHDIPFLLSRTFYLVP